MTVIAETRTDLKPTYQARPDMRFATTFLSNEYRDYAVNGESLVDKTTGELFIKRPEDGRVVSFFQNKKYMSDLMLDLRVLLNNNASFLYPTEEDLDACYLSTDYDMMSLYENKDISIVDSDQIIPNTEDNVTNIKFRISKKSNGFFCRLTSRDSDKAVIEYITNQYNAICKNYEGSDELFLEEKNRFLAIEKWEDSNASIEFDVIVSDDTGVKTFTFIDYIRINEESCIILPTNILPIIFNANDIMIKIKAIKYEKIHFMMNNISKLGTSFNDGLSKFMYPDNGIYIRYCNICNFVDDVTDITLLGNEFIIAMMDVPYVRRYMMKMSKLTSESNIVLSPTRPTDDIWSTNGIWAEQVRDVFKGGQTINMECEVNLKQLEMYLAENDDTDYVNFSKVTNKNHIYII